MKRRIIISQQDILDHQAISTVAGAGSGMMSQYLGMARVIAQRNEFPEYQAMALAAERLPDGSVRITTPFEEAWKKGPPKAPANVTKPAAAHLIPTDWFPWIIGFLLGVAATNVWEVVTSCGG